MEDADGEKFSISTNESVTNELFSFTSSNLDSFLSKTLHWLKNKNDVLMGTSEYSVSSSISTFLDSKAISSSLSRKQSNQSKASKIDINLSSVNGTRSNLKRKQRSNDLSIHTLDGEYWLPVEGGRKRRKPPFLFLESVYRDGVTYSSNDKNNNGRKNDKNPPHGRKNRIGYGKSNHKSKKDIDRDSGVRKPNVSSFQDKENHLQLMNDSTGQNSSRSTFLLESSSIKRKKASNNQRIFSISSQRNISGLDGDYWKLPEIISINEKRMHRSRKPPSNIIFEISSSTYRKRKKMKKRSTLSLGEQRMQFSSLKSTMRSSTSTLCVSRTFQMKFSGNKNRLYLRRFLLLERKQQEREEKMKKLYELQRRSEEESKGKEIFRNLFLGNKIAAKNKEWLLNNNVKYILNVTKEVKNFFENSGEGFMYKKIRVTDLDNENLLRYFDEASNFIRAGLESGKGVLVHCSQGRCRSVAIVMAYLIRDLKWDLKTCFETISVKLHNVHINDGFKRQLMDFELLLTNRRTIDFFQIFPRERSSLRV